MQGLLVSILFSVVTSNFCFASPSAVCVTSDRANLRQGPSIQAEKTWEVYKFMPFRQLEKKRDWVKVKDLDGDLHWIHAPLVTENKPCAVVKTEYANLRQGPGTHYPQKNKATKYTGLELLKVQGDWARVRAEDNQIYWVSKDLLWINKERH